MEAKGREAKAPPASSFPERRQHSHCDASLVGCRKGVVSACSPMENCRIPRSCFSHPSISCSGCWCAATATTAALAVSTSGAESDCCSDAASMGNCQEMKHRTSTAYLVFQGSCLQCITSVPKAVWAASCELRQNACACPARMFVK